jgi:hypothetical protein
VCERFLPASVLSRASLRGNEYAWPLAAVEATVAAAAASGLANLGGQAQFRIPDGTCELYWLSVDSGERRRDETWDAYVTRTAAEVRTQFAALRERTDFVNEALQWPQLARLHAEGVDLNQYLCFVLYFDPPSLAATEQR